MIAIPNIDMPKSCGECEFVYNLVGGSYEWWECAILHDDINQFDTRRTDCPLIDIVTCGECKWCDDKGKGRALICTNPYIDMDIHPLDFCSYGERANNTRTESL